MLFLPVKRKSEIDVGKENEWFLATVKMRFKWLRMSMVDICISFSMLILPRHKKPTPQKPARKKQVYASTVIRSWCIKIDVTICAGDQTPQ